MDRTTLAVIHCEPAIAWQAPFAAKMAAGLRAIGIRSVTTSDRARHDEGFPILLGTSLWRALERPPYLLVDRCSFGDTNRFVSLVWNGHGRRGDHKVPTNRKVDRWELHGGELQPWRGGLMGATVLAGQHEPYSPKWRTMADWYRSAANVCTHFRPHPAIDDNPTSLPVWRSFDGVARMVTLNSSVAIEATLRGIPTTVEDEGGMAWPGFRGDEDRLPWLRRLAWTQWTHDEIAEGQPIRHLFE